MFNDLTPSITGIIAGTNITVRVPLGTDLTNLSPTITHTGTGIIPASGAAQDFSRPVQYTVTAANSTIAVYTVTVRWSPLDPGADVSDWLTGQSGGTTPAAPVILPVALDLAGTGWTNLLSEIDSAAKYVALDLSGCDMTGTEFDPGSGSTGTDKIVSLVLPDTAESIAAGGNWNAAAFKNFTALTSVSGAGIRSIGDYAFSYCHALETVDLPVATSIGLDAFHSCYALTTLSLPASPPTLGANAYVFQDTGIVTGIGTTLTIRVPSAAAVSAYTASTPPGWNVSADTAAGWNTAVYGPNHKRIVITD